MNICAFLCRKNFDFKWACQTRLDEITPEIMEQMYRAGCRLIYCGIESAQSFDRGQKFDPEWTIAQSRETIKRLERRSMEVLCFYIIDPELPPESPETQATLRLMHSLPSSYASLHRRIPYLDPDFIKREMLHSAKDRYPINTLIRSQLLKFYLRPERISALIKRQGGLALLKRQMLFWRVLRQF